MWVLLCTRERTALAEGPPGEGTPRRVEIKMVAKHEDRALMEVLSELLDRLQVTARFSTVPDLEAEEMWTPHPGAPAAVARAWIDLRDAGQVTLYLTGDRQDRVLVRQVPLVISLDEVAREEIAHIVEAAVDELLLGGQIGVEKKHDADLPPKVVLPPPLPEPPLRLDIGFGYSVQAWDTNRALLHGPAAFASLAMKSGPWRPGLWLSAEQRFQEDLAAPPYVTTTLNQGGIRLLFVVDRTLSSRWMVRGGLGGGADWVHITSTPVGDVNHVVTAKPARTSLVPMLRGLGTARYAFTSKSELFFGFSLDFDLRGTTYVRQDYDAQGTEILIPVFEPWRFRPMALLGITADVLAY
jgi:hypothetical protein